MFGSPFGRPFSPIFGPRAGGWTIVDLPAGWSWDPLPFDILQNERDFQPATNFDLQTYAGISVATTYYVDKSTGLDTNTGLSWAQAFKTIKKAWGMADVDRVYVRNGYFYRSECYPITWTRNIETIATDGNVHVTSDFYPDIGAWSLVDSHYEANILGSLDRYADHIWDNTNLDSHGDPIPLTRKTSIAEVDAAANSFWQDYTNTPNRPIYIRTFDDRLPDSDLRVCDSVALAVQKDNYTLYFKNIHFRDYTRYRNNSAAGGLKGYFEDCEFKTLVASGVSELILLNCNIHGFDGDGLNYDVRNTIVSNVIEIDTHSYNHGTTADNQASTSHNGCNIVRIMGNYHHTAGQNIADVSGSKSWNLGCIAHDGGSAGSGSAIGFLSGSPVTTTIWLDRCYAYNNADGLYYAADTNILYYRNLQAGSPSGTGTIAEY